MSLKKNILLTFLGIFCSLLFVISFLYYVPRISLLSVNAVPATVSDADRDGTSGYAVLKVNMPREDGGTVFFHYYYPGSSCHLKKGSEVLVSGSIIFMDQSTERGINSGLVIGTRIPVIAGLAISLISLLGASFFLLKAIRNYIHKPWSKTEETEVKMKSADFLYTTEIFVLLIAGMMFLIGILQVGKYLGMEEHTTGVITYQSNRQSSQFVKVYQGNSVDRLNSTYGKGFRTSFIVLQIQSDTPINGEDEFWYEGKNIVIGSDKVYLGYSGDEMIVLTQTELLFAWIGGGALILLAMGTIFVRKRNRKMTVS